MEITGKIVFDASPALLNTANRIADALAGKCVEPRAKVAESLPEPAQAVSGDVGIPNATPSTPESDVPAEKPAETTESKREVTIEQLRAVIAAKAKAGKREVIKAIINELGAQNATTLDPAKYAEAFEKISAL